VRSDGGAAPAVDRPPRWARPWVWTLLVAVLVCGVTGLEAWPFSAFRLFSQVRTPHVLSYRLAIVDHTGAERSVPLHALPAGFRGLNLDLADAAAGVPADRRALCDAIAGGARRLGGDVSVVRVYAVDRDLSRPVDRTSGATSHLMFSCPSGAGADGDG
jgi:hypothetical protein